MTETKETFSNIVWFTILGFLRPAINIFLLPLYLVKITPSDYGILALVTAFSALVAAMSGLKIEVAAKTFYFDYYKNKTLLKDYLGQIYTTNLSISLFYFLVLLAFGSYLFEHIFKSESITYLPFGILAVGQVLLSASNTIYYGYLKNELKVKEFVILNVIGILLTILLQAIFILYYNLGVLGILLGRLIPSAALFLYIVIKNSWLINFKLKKETLKPSFLFGFGFLPISLLLVFEKQIDKLIIERYLSLEEVGLYALLLSIIGFFIILVAAYHNAITPILYKSLKSNDDKTEKTVNSILNTYTSVGIFALAGILVVGNHFHLFTDNPKYLSIQKYFPYAIAATIPKIFIRFQILIILFYKKSFHMSIVTLVKTGIMILFMIYLIPKYGIYGAILSFGISFILYYIGLSMIKEKITSIKINYLGSFLRSLPFLALLVFHLFIVQWISGATSSIIVFCLSSLIIYGYEKNQLLQFLKTKT